MAKIMLEYGAPVAFVNLALSTNPKSVSHVNYQKAKAWGLIDHTPVAAAPVRYQPASEIWPLNMNKTPSLLWPQYPSLVKDASETPPAPIPTGVLNVPPTNDEETRQTKTPDVTMQKLLFGR